MRQGKLNQLRWKITWKLRNLRKKYPLFSEPATMMLNDVWKYPELVKNAYKLATQHKNDYHRALYAHKKLLPQRFNQIASVSERPSSSLLKSLRKLMGGREGKRKDYR